MTLNKYLNTYVNNSPLIVFRILFGLLIFFSQIRFWHKGWIESIYIDPAFHFSYNWFSWVKPIGDYTYLLFIICLISSLFIVVGFKYRVSSLILFLSYTYIELMDKTTYLNHYYLVSLMLFMLIFLPASSRFSIDSLKTTDFCFVPRWTIDSLKIMLCIVYFHAGIAKVNSDWLLSAQPLKIWLLGNYDVPLIGDTLLQLNWVHYAMSWGGMLYDILIPFLLLIPKTRNIAFLLVIIFHVLTKILFPAIGMFPFIMILGCLVFFDYKFHEKIIQCISKYLKKIQKNIFTIKKNESKIKTSLFSVYIIGFFLFIQFLLPLRHNLYDGELFWTERGYRFSWRVMLVEKKGFTEFKLVDNDKSNSFYIKNEDHLTDFQEKQMSFQPDFIKEFADYLGDFYKAKGYSNIEIHVNSYVTLNGRRSKRLIKRNTDILNIDKKTFYENCIIPFGDEIKKI